ncbi:hypothetical protein [Clostridium senegalense]|uniref:Uncharacterized protein n=1 Tax=Clostridium senegalense TaxID=1465809 RepID=A0A6M0H6J9_9CLOT|nr:hypothetical protein [Clostridium senegalense]NEU05924.1 hypothetical protein [Clostridium senegalense]
MKKIRRSRRSRMNNMPNMKKMKKLTAKTKREIKKFSMEMGKDMSIMIKNIKKSMK